MYIIKINVCPTTSVPPIPSSDYDETLCQFVVYILSKVSVTIDFLITNLNPLL